MEIKIKTKKENCIVLDSCTTMNIMINLIMIREN